MISEKNVKMETMMLETAVTNANGKVAISAKMSSAKNLPARNTNHVETDLRSRPLMKPVMTTTISQETAAILTASSKMDGPVIS